MEGLEAVERLELGTVVGLILWVSLGVTHNLVVNLVMSVCV